MTDLTDLSALDLSTKLAAREITAVDLMRATLDRIAIANPKVNAIVSLRDEAGLMAEAALADQTPRRGWLHGIPIAIKDLTDTKGLRTTYGSPLFADHVPDKDHLVAARLRAAGAIIIGKTNTPEFGLGSNTFNPVHGISRNAYSAGHTAGGSSGGASVALATRMLSVADGSDMMGSLRNPAAWGNVYGMRPSYGVVPSDPKGDVFLHPLSTSGPMARDPLDLAHLLETLSGPDLRQPGGQAFTAADVQAADMSGKKIGWLGDWGGAYPYEAGISTLCEEALSVFTEMGAQVEAVDAPHPAEEIWDSWITLRSWAVAAGLEPMYNDSLKRERLKDSAIWEIERGLGFSAMQVHRASVAASVWYARAAELFTQYDALVLPSAQVWPFVADIQWMQQVAGKDMDTYHRWMEVVIPVSLIGLPAVNLPCGFGAAGLPMGMQMFGARGADAALLSMAQSYHLATDWPSQRPAIL